MKHIEQFVQYLLRLFFLLGLSIGLGAATSGCATAPLPVVVNKPIVLAPADNLLADCEIEPPPAKTVYLRQYNPIVDKPDLSIAKDPYPYTAQYIKALVRAAEERESLLMVTLLKNYQYINACNSRLKALRDWKLQATQAVQAVNQKE